VASYNCVMQQIICARVVRLSDILAQRIIILDGVMGTMIQRFTLGGCCGTTPDHIGAIAKAVEKVPARKMFYPAQV